MAASPALGSVTSILQPFPPLPVFSRQPSGGRACRAAPPVLGGCRGTPPAVAVAALQYEGARPASAACSNTVAVAAGRGDGGVDRNVGGASCPKPRIDLC